MTQHQVAGREKEAQATSQGMRGRLEPGKGEGMDSPVEAPQRATAPPCATSILAREAAWDF